jgi:hypothetical protein
MLELLALCEEFPEVSFRFKRVPDDLMNGIIVIRVSHVTKDDIRRELPVYVSDGERRFARRFDVTLRHQLREAAQRVLRGE